MNKLIVAWIVEGDEDCWKLSYNSVKDVADKVIIIDGNKEVDQSRYKATAHINNTSYLTVPYEHEYIGANGKQRNVYLNYLKQHHVGDWCLVLDADEVVDYPERIPEAIKLLENNKGDVASIKMRHFIWNFANEDATQDKHWVPNRLFKVTDKLFYDEVEHPVLRGWEEFTRQYLVETFCIWHLAYSREAFRLHKKYLNHNKKSNIHTSQFLTEWYHAHLFGAYPTKRVDYNDLPPVLIKAFDINKDFMYFKNRGFESKHFFDAVNWVEYFKPKTFLEVGCGLGNRVYCMSKLGVDSYGFDISSFAVENSPYSSIKNNLTVNDITNKDLNKSISGGYDLVVIYDVLEHVEENDLKVALSNIKYLCSKNVLFSIPFEGDPNLYNDKTHKIFKSRDWWVNKITEAGFRLKPVPEYFNFRQQVLVGEVY